MNWQAVSFDWNLVRAFLATAEEGSFSGAARALGSTQPTIGRQVSALEEQLGVVLLERGRRGLTLTSAGRDLLAHVSAMGEAATRLSLAATGLSTEVAGRVTVTAVDLFAIHLLPGMVADLRQSHPGLVLDIVPSDDLRDILKREVDIAIRHVDPVQPELIAKKLATGRAYFYAARSYLDRMGRPKSVADLAGHHFIGPGDMTRMEEVLGPTGVRIAPEQYVVATPSSTLSTALAQEGLGLSLMWERLAEGMPEMERVARDFPGLDFPIWLVTHRELHSNPRIRIVFDAIAALF